MSSGTLYIVATPIGNLEDMTARALKTLQKVDVILAEDTRHSKHLLTHFGIHTQMISVNANNEIQKTSHIISMLDDEKSLAYIVDAGTPLISDPGGYLVREARAKKHKVVPIPGACALVTALSVSGRMHKSFSFEGFLSAKASQRRKQLTELKNEKR